MGRFACLRRRLHHLEESAAAAPPPQRHQCASLATPPCTNTGARRPTHTITPALALKLWTLCTLIFEALALSAPEIAVLGAPEVVELFDWRYPKPGKDVPRLIEFLLPPGSDGSMDVARATRRLVLLRRMMIGGWLAFLALPPHRNGWHRYASRRDQ